MKLRISLLLGKLLDKKEENPKDLDLIPHTKYDSPHTREINFAMEFFS